jgi:hypothetical protein
MRHFLRILTKEGTPGPVGDDRPPRDYGSAADHSAIAIVTNDDRDSPPFPAHVRVPRVEVTEDTFNVKPVGITFPKTLI